MAIPIANAQIYEQVPLSARMANRGCRLPPPNRFHALATFLCLPLHFEHEFTEGEIGDFPSPQPFHAIEVQVLKETDVKLAEKFQRKFPVVILALSGNLSVRPCVVLTRTLAVVATAHLSRHLTIGTLYLFGRSLIEFRRLVFCAIRTGQESLVAIVEPCSITRLGFGRKSFIICCDSDIPITECVTFDGDTRDITLQSHENTRTDTSDH